MAIRRLEGNPQDAARGLRQVLAYLTDDEIMLGSVVADMDEDPRGFRETVLRVMSSLVMALGDNWAKQTSREVAADLARARIQQILLEEGRVEGNQ